MPRRKASLLEGKKENLVNKNTRNTSGNLETQVKALKPKVYRRKFSKSDKLKILQSYDACIDIGERGALLRKEGLYSASITKWRQQLSEQDPKRANKKGYKFILLHNQVLRENTTLKKKLAQAEAIIDLQKKVSELLTANILKPEMSEE